jgi:hypothetical protein
MIKKLSLLVCLTLALVATVSADIPMPPCAPDCVLVVPAR